MVFSGVRIWIDRRGNSYDIKDIVQNGSFAVFGPGSDYHSRIEILQMTVLLEVFGFSVRHYI